MVNLPKDAIEIDLTEQVTRAMHARELSESELADEAIILNMQWRVMEDMQDACHYDLGWYGFIPMIIYRGHNDI